MHCADHADHTANTARPQTETFSEFVSDLQLELPQISQDHKDMLTEKITQDELEVYDREPGPELELEP